MNYIIVVNVLCVFWELFGIGKDTVFISETECVHEVWAEFEKELYSD
jgi:hypothetical protein